MGGDALCVFVCFDELSGCFCEQILREGAPMQTDGGEVIVFRPS